MIKVPITTEMKEQASWMRDETIKNKNYDVNYTGIDLPTRWYDGYLGELVFEQFLKDNNKEYKYEPICDGNGHKVDFFLTILGLTMSFDVKSSSHPNAQKMMQPTAQYNISNISAYVGLHLLEDSGNIMGYCTKTMLMSKPDGFTAKKTPTHYIPFTSMWDIKTLLPKISNRSQLQQASFPQQ